MNKKEFEILLMLYASGIDGQIQQDEVESMLEHTDEKTFKKVKKTFAGLSDYEILQLVNENKDRFATDKEELMADIKAVVAADGEHKAIEGQLLRFIKKLL